MTSAFRVALLTVCLLAAAAVAPAAMISYTLDQGGPSGLRIDALLDDQSVAGSLQVTLSVVTDATNTLTGDIFAVGFGFNGSPSSTSGTDIWGSYTGSLLAAVPPLDAIYGIGPNASALLINNQITSTTFTFGGLDVSDIALIGAGLHYVGPPGVKSGPLSLGIQWGAPPAAGGNTEVPEPGTMTLLGGALAALVLMRRRRASR